MHRRPNRAVTLLIVRRFRRGFTLFEMMVVVAIIGVFAALAVPGVVTRMRDRRVQTSAQEIATMYRTARMRAVGRGGAQLVRFTAPTGAGLGKFELFEAVQAATTVPGELANQTGACGSLPMSSCSLTTWPAAGAITATGARRVTKYPTTAHEDDAYTQITVSDSLYDVCFAPSGRMFSRTTASGTFASVTNVPTLALQRLEMGSNAPIGLTRRVLLLPNGSVRLEL